MSGYRDRPMAAPLDPPLGPDDHVEGPDDAPLQLVMYGDFQCPYCAAAQSILRRVRERLDGRAALRLPPLPAARPSRRRERRAGVRGGRRAGRVLADARPPLRRPRPPLARRPRAHADAIGLDGARVRREVAEGVHAERVARDDRSARRRGSPARRRSSSTACCTRAPSMPARSSRRSRRARAPLSDRGAPRAAASSRRRAARRPRRSAAAGASRSIGGRPAGERLEVRALVDEDGEQVLAQVVVDRGHRRTGVTPSKRVSRPGPGHLLQPAVTAGAASSARARPGMRRRSSARPWRAACAARVRGRRRAAAPRAATASSEARPAVRSSAATRRLSARRTSPRLRPVRSATRRYSRARLA